MKKLFLAVSILFASMFVQAQQRISDIHYTKLQIYSSEYDSLYNGHNHDYYDAIFKRATKMRNTGIGLASAGVGLFAGAMVASGTNLNTTAVLLYLSIAPVCVGFPFWIAGSVKRQNNMKAMKQIKRNTNISFRTTNTGIGLVLNF